jgi:hypothetical protein
LPVLHIVQRKVPRQPASGCSPLIDAAQQALAVLAETFIEPGSILQLTSRLLCDQRTHIKLRRRVFVASFSRGDVSRGTVAGSSTRMLYLHLHTYQQFRQLQMFNQSYLVSSRNLLLNLYDRTLRSSSFAPHQTVTVSIEPLRRMTLSCSVAITVLRQYVPRVTVPLMAK